MPDELDRIQEREEMILGARIEAARNGATKLRPRGNCYSCQTPTESEGQLYCDADCAADDARLKLQRRQRI